MRKLTLGLLFLAACGLAGDTLFLDLTEEDKESVCQEEIDATVETTFTCEGIDFDMDGEDDEFAWEKADLSDCVAGFDVTDDCTATLDDWYDCGDAIEADPCVLFEAELPSACSYMTECYATE